MATTNLGLPTIADNMTADVVRDINALAEAVDQKAAAKTDSAAIQGQVNALNQSFNTHKSDEGLHVTAAKQSAWDAKQNALPVENRRKITFGTAAPVGGVDGDIYFQYE